MGKFNFKEKHDKMVVALSEDLKSFINANPDIENDTLFQMWVIFKLAGLYVVAFKAEDDIDRHIKEK